MSGSSHIPIISWVYHIIKIFLSIISIFFSMFYSYLPYSDLIFQDAAQKLIVLPEEQRHHRTYLGREFTKAFEEVECAYVGSCGHVQVSRLVMALIGLLTIEHVL